MEGYFEAQQRLRTEIREPAGAKKWLDAEIAVRKGDHILREAVKHL